MGYAPPDEVIQQKILIAGGFGVGKTTVVSTVSECEPLLTEEQITEPSRGIDDLSHTAHKTTTTVAMDFGRITLTEGIQLMLFGAPGQDRFLFMWDELVTGAIGAVVLVDTRRLDDSFPAVTYFEHRDLPFIVAINDFPSPHRYTEDEVRAALRIPTRVPVVRFDALDAHEARQVLIRVVEHALELATTS